MPDKLQKLLTLLEVERIDKYLFIGNSPSYPPRVFGGQVTGAIPVCRQQDSWTPPATLTQCTPTSCARATRRSR